MYVIQKKITKVFQFHRRLPPGSAAAGPDPSCVHLQGLYLRDLTAAGSGVLVQVLSDLKTSRTKALCYARHCHSSRDHSPFHECLVIAELVFEYLGSLVIVGFASMRQECMETVYRMFSFQIFKVEVSLGSRSLVFISPGTQHGSWCRGVRGMTAV